MHITLQKNVLFLHQAQTRYITTLKVGTRLKGCGRERDKWEQKANRKARCISQPEGDITKQKNKYETNEIKIQSQRRKGRKMRLENI